MIKHKGALIWSKVQKKIPYSRIRAIRLDLNIPENGFDSDEQRDLWEVAQGKYYKIIYAKYKRDNIDKDLKESAWYKMLEHVEVIESEFPDIAEGFRNVLEEYIFFGNVLESTLAKVDATGCSIKTIGPDSSNKEKGLYIKIGPNTTSTDIRDFVNKNGRLIKFYKELAYESKPKRHKSFNESKNTLALLLDTFSLPELIMIYKNHTGLQDDDIGILKRKDFVAVRIMKARGYKITDDNYRQIVSREKRRRTV